MRRLGFTFRRARRVPEKAACPKRKQRAQKVLLSMHRLNVLGFLSRKSRLHFFQAQEKITAAFVIEGVEALLPQLSGPTVLVLDNASVHRFSASLETGAGQAQGMEAKGMEAKWPAPVVFTAVLPAPELD